MNPEYIQKLWAVWLLYAIIAVIFLVTGFYYPSKDCLIGGVCFLILSVPWYLHSWLLLRPEKRNVAIHAVINFLILLGASVGCLFLVYLTCKIFYGSQLSSINVLTLAGSVIFFPIIFYFFVVIVLCLEQSTAPWNWDWNWVTKLKPDFSKQPKADSAWDENPTMPETGIRLGTKNGKVYRYNGNTHLITFAQTRGGKGTTSIIPNLLEYDGPVFVIDPKGENALNSIGYRQDVLGRKVVVLDPFNESGIANARFNPMEFIKADNINDDCEQLAESLITMESHDPFWDYSARSLLAATIFFVYKESKKESEKNLSHVSDKMLIDRADFFEEMNKDKTLHPTIRHAAAEVLKGAENTEGSIFSSLRANLTFLNDDKIRENLSGPSNFSVKDFLEGKIDVFLVLPLEKLDRYKRWLRLILSAFMKDLLNKSIANDKKTKLFILDEFGNLGHLQALENAFTTIAGRNIILWPFIQSFQQLQKDYPKAWRTILGQAGHKEIFNLGDDMEAAEYVSKILGKTTVLDQTISKSSGSSSSSNDKGSTYGSNSGGSDTIREKEVLLLQPDQVARFDPTKKIILRQGEKPVQILKTPYFADPKLSAKWKNSLAWVTKNYPNTEEFIAAVYPKAYAEIKKLKKE